jgi:hypothetical protein
MRSWRAGFILEDGGEALEGGPYIVRSGGVGLKERRLLVCLLSGVSPWLVLDTLFRTPSYPYLVKYALEAGQALLRVVARCLSGFATTSE